ncbi:uncharacterized protein P884DRAFT_253324 [Thermothelomyces heterothallicus CBS 202.75]|uniref:uncharacterized protein n=1 Tax=Thermothelomyces heterothallicus CBS 202.75 TaxID=1149848 RepID=UPI0037436100
MRTVTSALPPIQLTTHLVTWPLPGRSCLPSGVQRVAPESSAAGALAPEKERRARGIELDNEY